VPLAINEKWQPPSYVNEGQAVLVPHVLDGRVVGLRCIVVVAAGDHARVTNEKFGVDKWFRVGNLRVEMPRGPRALRRLTDPEGA